MASKAGNGATFMTVIRTPPRQDLRLVGTDVLEATLRLRSGCGAFQTALP